MARYYYKVYTAKRGYELRYLGNTTVAAGDSIAGWETHSLNYNTGEHWCTDWKEIWYYENDTTTYVCKVLTDGVTVHKTRWMEPANRLATTRRYETYLTDYEKDRLVKTIIAEDGTYPDDGYDSTTGYWYVKGAIVFPAFHMKIDGQLKTSENGWVKIDGVLRPIEKIWVKINGELKVV